MYFKTKNDRIEETIIVPEQLQDYDKNFFVISFVIGRSYCFMKKLFFRVTYFLNRMANANVTPYAAYATLFIIISLFPFTMLLLSTLRFLPITEASLLNMIYKVIPATLHSFAESIINDLYAKSSGTLLSLSAVTAFWSASSGVYGLFNGLNAVYGVRDRRMWIHRRFICIFYTIIFLFIIVGALFLLVFGNSLQLYLIRILPFMAEFDWMLSMIRNLLMLAVMVIFFTLIYYTFPDLNSDFVEHIPGAVFASLGWILFSYFFSIYIDNFNNYSRMYGSLTGIVLAMLWLFVCMHIIFIGGMINAIIIERNVMVRLQEYDLAKELSEQKR